MGGGLEEVARALTLVHNRLVALGTPSHLRISQGSSIPPSKQAQDRLLRSQATRVPLVGPLRPSDVRDEGFCSQTNDLVQAHSLRRSDAHWNPLAVLQQRDVDTNQRHPRQRQQWRVPGSGNSER